MVRPRGRLAGRASPTHCWRRAELARFSGGGVTPRNLLVSWLRRDHRIPRRCSPGDRRRRVPGGRNRRSNCGGERILVERHKQVPRARRKCRSVDRCLATDRRPALVRRRSGSGRKPHGLRDRSRMAGGAARPVSPRSVCGTGRRRKRAAAARTTRAARADVDTSVHQDLNKFINPPKRRRTCRTSKNVANRRTTSKSPHA